MTPPMPLFNALIAGAVEGPFTAGQLRAMEENGTIRGDTQVARQDEGEWLPLEVWREVIHGAPTHRGAVPKPASTVRANGTSAFASGLVKVALVLALLGIALAIAGATLPIPEGRTIGLSLLALASVLWIIGASRK